MSDKNSKIQYDMKSRHATARAVKRFVKRVYQTSLSSVESEVHAMYQ